MQNILPIENLHTRNLCSSSPNIAGSEGVHLFVRLSAGLPNLQGPSNRMREVTFHLHDLNDTIVSRASLQLITDGDSRARRHTWDLKSSLTDRTEDSSGRVFTGIKFNRVSWIIWGRFQIVSYLLI